MSQQEKQESVPANYEITEDYTLKNMMGGDAGIAKVFSQENISRAQKVINDAKEEFFATTQAALMRLRETIYAELPSAGGMGSSHLSRVHQHVISLRNQSETLKFPFISLICKYIEQVCLAPQKASINYTHLTRDMLDVLRLALQHKILDSTHPMAGQIEQSMEAVAARIAS